MKHFIATTIVLLSVITITSCKKSHEIIWVGGKPEADTAIITIKSVETIKDTDRDGDYYKDIFLVENKHQAGFLSADHDATFDIGLLATISYDPTSAGEQISVLRRQKNVTYKLNTYWKVPGGKGEYVNTYNFTSTGEY